MSAHTPHHHGHTIEDLDWDAMADHLEREAELRAPLVEEAVAWLRGLLLEGGIGPDTAERLLDVGSGPGVHTAQLAHAFPQARVVAVDAAPSLLERARNRAEREGLSRRLEVREAQLPEELGSLGSSDLIWTSNVVHHIGDQQAALDALATSLRPGGLLAVVERGLQPRWLPRDIGVGRPGLQARLDAANEEWFTGMREGLPGHTATVEDWPAMLARAGLTPAGSRTFLIDLPAPLERRAREHIHAQLTRSREKLGEWLDADDLLAVDALIDEEAPTGILKRPDAFYVAAGTVHTGRAT